MEFPVGPTAATNLHPACTHHHRLKHHTTWTATSDGHGGLTWTSPTAHTYPVPSGPVLGDPPPTTAPAATTANPTTTARSTGAAQDEGFPF